MLTSKYFDDRIISVSEALPLLPFFHCCDAYYIESILESGILDTYECNVFNKEKLLYLSYGKPAYKSKNDVNNDLNFLLPVCFVINSRNVDNIKRIFPFDTGGFEKYKEYMHDKMTLNDFIMNPNSTALSKIINFFYAGNTDYYDGNARKTVDFDPIHFPVEAYHKLITGHERRIANDRKASIEIQLDKPLKLIENSVIAIIVPEIIASSDYVQRKVNQLKADLVTFRTKAGIAPGDYYFHLLEITKEYLFKKKILSIKSKWTQKQN